MPFIVYWKGQIQPFISDAVISQLDLLSSLASLVGSEVRSQDGKNLLDVLMGKSQNGRDELILEATSRTALRKGDWILIPPYSEPALNKLVNIELGNSNDYQLYNLKEDIGEQNNLAKTNKRKLEELISSFEKIRGKNYQDVHKIELK